MLIIWSDLNDEFLKSAGYAYSCIPWNGCHHFCWTSSRCISLLLILPLPGLISGSFTISTFNLLTKVRWYSWWSSEQLKMFQVSTVRILYRFTLWAGSTCTPLCLLPKQTRRKESPLIGSAWNWLQATLVLRWQGSSPQVRWPLGLDPDPLLFILLVA